MALNTIIDMIMMVATERLYNLIIDENKHSTQNLHPSHLRLLLSSALHCSYARFSYLVQVWSQKQRNRSFQLA